MKGVFPNLVILTLGSCTNDNVGLKSSILGKWSVVGDSLNFGGDIKNYSKSSADYYEFLANNTLIIKEGNQLDTADYVILSDTAININFKNPAGVRVIVIENGLVTKDSIQNRFSQKFSVRHLSIHQVSLSAYFSYIVDNPPIQSAPGTNSVLVKATINLKK